MAGVLITMAQAKNHLRVGGTHEDDDIQMKLVQAQAIILEYLSDVTDATWTAVIDAWTDDTVPGQVQAAILLQLGYLYRYRGDGADETTLADGNLAPGVKSCLYRLRTPVLA